MGLSYNPSSFATNKTILEAIEELKRYLMANPLACIYQCYGSVTPDSTFVYLTNIVVPDGQEIKAGDIVLAMNGYFNFVDSVESDRVTFVDNWGNLGLDVQSITLNFDSIYGEIVDTPANFTDWIYRRFPRTNDRYYRGRQYYLEITYKDSTAFPTIQTARIDIPCNYLNAIWYELNVDNSTTIYFDFTEDISQQIYQLTDFTIPSGQNGADGVSITGATIDASNHLILTLSDGNTIDAGALPTPVITASSIDSETATLGQVLTADGTGGASWTTVSAGGYDNTVSITATSGTFSNSDFAKLGYGDSTIIYTDAYSISTVYKLKLETASILEFEAIDAASRNNLKLIDVNKTTKAYSMTAISMITSSTISSGTATSGKVLTANGSGGCSWETAGGGGSTLYQHFIEYSFSGTINMIVRALIINTTSTAYSNATDCFNDLWNKSIKYFIATGKIIDNNNINGTVISCDLISNSFCYVRYIDLTTGELSVIGKQMSTQGTLTDRVCQIS